MSHYSEHRVTWLYYYRIIAGVKVGFDYYVQTFIGAGFSREQVIEVILGITQKTLSNYVNHLADTPLDDAFAPREWAAARVG